MDHGRVNSTMKLGDQGITGLAEVYYNQSAEDLTAIAVDRGEGVLGKGGALLVSTGKHTGRSPKDKFVVRTPATENTIWWENNPPMEVAAFDRLYADMTAHMQGRDYFVQDLFGGADPAHRLDVRMVTELAWHGLFIRHMLRRPAAAELDSFTPDFTIINCPTFKTDPERHGCRSETVIALNFDRKLILIGGTEYAGENKKSVFTLLNYLLPEKGIMPMHCSANHAPGNPVDTAIFFGLSGTGKTTLSADPTRILIGDDEHGWSDRGTFNFEGGCYAKTINLSAEAEPEIYATTQMPGTVIENMVYHAETKELDFDDDSLTANMRCAYPLHYISNASDTALGGHPKNIIMLTCDAFGVLPPMAGSLRRRRCIISCRGSPQRSPAPNAASPNPSRRSRPVSAPPSCRAAPRSTATCCAARSPATARPAGWSTPAGPAAPMAPATGCRSGRREPCWRRLWTEP